MRAAIRLLTLVCLLWCGLHIAEPAAAHAGAGTTVVALDASPPADPCDSEAADKATHAGHHHCPIAPDQRVAGATAAPAGADATRFASRAAALASLTRAPPLQPPAA